MMMAARETQTGQQIQEMEERVNTPSHGQTTNDFLPDVVRGWLGRSRIVEALKQQWPDHELHGDRQRDHGRKYEPMRKQKSTSVSRRCFRMKQQQRASESWGVSEPTSWEGAAGAEDAMFDGSFADEDEEEVFNVAGAPLNEALAAERSAK